MVADVEMTFDSSVREEILNLFDKDLDKDNFIIEKNNPFQKVITNDGQEIHLDEFGGIKRGSEIFIKSDLISIMRLSKEDGLA